jgi:hypothetical protein
VECGGCGLSKGTAITILGRLRLANARQVDVDDVRFVK